jgi:uncharacterized Zn-finger protein
MGLRDLLGNSVFIRAVLVLWIVSSVFVVFLLTRIDAIVHGTLYDFGLQFDLAWAGPYWAFTRLLYACLAVPSILSAVALTFSFLNKGEKKVKRVPKVVESKPSVNKVQPQPVKEDNHMVVSCPSCKRVFGKPLVMLDFSSGKTRLVNVCPYCNHVLGDADEKASDVDVQVVDLNKKEVNHK